jgi:predicted RNA-binding protein with RPS1 domain
MSAPAKDRHIGKPINLRAPPDLILHIEEYRKSQGLETRSEAVLKLLEKALSNSPENPSEILDYKTCEQRNEIPKYYPKFIICIERDEDSGRIIKKQTITEEQCRACNLYGHNSAEIQSISDLMEIGDKLAEKIDKLETREQELKEEIKNLELQEPSTKEKNERIEQLEPENAAFQYLVPKLNQRIKKLEENIEAMEKEERWRKSTEASTQEIREQSRKLEESRRIAERVVEEKKTTEKFLSTEEPKRPSEMTICSKTGKLVSVDDECNKNCLDIAECQVFQRIIEQQKKGVKVTS